MTRQTSTFFDYFGHHGVCVLPDDVLNDTPLPDPETGKDLPSLRNRCSSTGLCYARVEKAYANGNYRAYVSSSPEFLDKPDSAEVECVALTEENLIYAVAWDERVYRREPAEIRRLMRACARERAPLRSRTKPVPATDSLPGSVVDLSVDHGEDEPLSVEVTVNDIPESLRQGGLAIQSVDEPPTAADSSMHITPVAPCVIQQALLRTMRKALHRQLARTHNQARVQELKTCCILVARVQDWQRQTRQRVVHVKGCRWCVMRQCWVWKLTLEMPKLLLAEPATRAAAA
jgi:hypothetical protein